MFGAASGLAAPWQVTSVEFDQGAGRLDLGLDFPRGCPERWLASFVETASRYPRAGTPLTTARPGTLRVTTAPAPTVALGPTVSPCSTQALEPMVAPA